MKQYNIVKDNQISIDKELWVELNLKYSKEEIKDFIHDTIEENNLPFPRRDISEQDSRLDFSTLLLSNDTDLILNSEWFTRYEYKYSLKYNDDYMVIKTSPVGNKASDYFHQDSRFLCDSINAPSPIRSWENRKFRDGALNALWSLKQKEVNGAVLRNCIAMRKYTASQFRPSTAKFMYNYFNANKVLDMSSGWGDRLCGFYASNAHSYIGFDPNSNLHDGYSKQMEFYANELQGIDTKESIIHNSGSEFIDEVLNDEMFDFIFTSPPYFNIEKYSKDPTQSFKKYNKIDKWLSEFLFNSIKQAWDRLETNGLLAINISDVYSNHTVNNICDPMNDFISTLDGANYLGAIGYEMRKRPNSGALKGKVGIFAEPIWLWRKL